MTALREYQRRVCATIWDYWDQQGDAALAVLPTGAGKTVIAQALVGAHLDAVPDGHVLFVTHLTEVIGQTYRRFAPVFAERGYDTGIWCASLGEKRWCPVTVASVQSLHSLDELPGEVTMVVLDECHGVPESADSMYGKLLSKLGGSAHILGLTATPWRLDGGEIYGKGRLFPCVAAKVGIEELIEQGHLVPPRMAGSARDTRIELQGVPTTGGDYNLAVLAARANVDGLVARQVDDALTRIPFRKQVVWFCVDIAHAEAVCRTLNLMDPKGAMIVHSQMDSDEREAAMAKFTGGWARHIVNVNVLAEGWDCPGVDAIVLLRPTKSPARYVQMVGRGLRPAEGKEDCLVLDYAGVVANLGPITDPKVVTANTKKGTGRSPLKMCPDCYEYVSTSSRECPECGHEWPARELKGYDEAQDGTLLGRTPPEVRKVSTVTVGAHVSKAGNACLRITYGHGLITSTTEYLMFSFPAAEAKAKEALRQLGLPPDRVRNIFTVGQAAAELKRAAEAGELPDLDHIVVLRDGKYDRVVGRVRSKSTVMV